ncbi:glycosyltransferase family 9 protein [Methanococcus maripaludis]|uniref:ADP-heptose--LPS heptosyltransferase 2 n=1 Tax=Methanococcus maripaludis TaxID=39152 RepID=A0A2L1CDH0_METMI|nr:glycosyltransferase family 9 protein [Methanococcus maripaludis]AVB77136.1 ADP-heptose--LPS heptosyltransferase 2 [Methanococcus maripaludis]MBA2863647.1 lipopolysaccharide heptosyltransferase II [Methanococcus maripaludis]MBB6496347.1 lipopolysaccharide heptosyltransferase II [Methanococcus maripaludis]
MKILLFKIGAIGDTLMTTPLIKNLKDNFPDAKLHYLIGNYSHEVLKGNCYLDNTITFDEDIFFKKRFFDWINLIFKIRKENYDVVFVLDKHLIFNFTSLLFGIKKRIGFDRFNEGKFLTYQVPYFGRKHEIFYYLDLIKGLGINSEHKNCNMDLFLDKNDMDFADNFWNENSLNSKLVVGICPGGAKNIGVGDDDLRRWSNENYIELISNLNEKGFEVLLIGGNTDKELEKQIFKKNTCVSAIGKTTLKQSAALLKKCNIVVCNDSGPMHLAASVNKKVLSIFGPTHPCEKAPLHKKSTFLWKQVGCSPCYDLWGKFPKPCPYGKKCMENITVEDVFDTIQKSVDESKL